MPDGIITFDTSLDNAQLEKELARITKKIDGIEARIANKTSERNQIQEQLRAAKDEAIEALNNVEQLRNALKSSERATSVSGNITDPERYIAELDNQKRIKEELKEQEKILHQKEAVAERIEKKDADAVAWLERQTAELNREKAAASEVSDQIARSNTASERLATAMSGVTKRIDKMTNRVHRLMSRVLFFSVITIGLRSMRTWLGKFIKTNDEASSAIDRLKGALLTMAQPLVEVVIPALTMIVNILSRVIALAAQVLSNITGKTAAQSAEAAKSLYDQAEALDGVGSAASDAAKSMAGFDEINKLSSGSSSSGNTDVSPDFSWDMDLPEDKLNNILGLVKAIAIALATWKISSVLGGGLSNTLGALMLVSGAIELISSLFDAWSNGVSWENLQGSIFGITLVVAGLYAMLGPTAAGIGAIVGGLALLVTGFKDAFDNGWNLQNLFMSISGVLVTGIGIGALTGSFIPALIGGIASLLLAITVATGHGEELLFGVRQALDGFLKFFKGIFTGDMELAMSGLADIFGGLKTAANAVLSGIEDIFLGFFDWLDEKTGGRLHGILMFVKGLFSGVFGAVRSVVSNTFDAIHQIFGGFITFLSGVFTGDFDKAWEGVKDIFKGVWNGIVGILESAVNLIIRGINWLISKLNMIHFDIPDWVPLIGGKSFGINIQPVGEVQIPRLASGAVIPPNREFLAVLGDQKSGTNIEAPLSTIERAVENVLSRRGYGGGEQTVILQVDRRELGRVVYKLNNEESRRIGVTLTGV